MIEFKVPGSKFNDEGKNLDQTRNFEPFDNAQGRP